MLQVAVGRDFTRMNFAFYISSYNELILKDLKHVVSRTYKNFQMSAIPTYMNAYLLNFLCRVERIGFVPATVVACRVTSTNPVLG